MADPRNEPRCRICTHPSMLAINQAILNGKPQRAVARDFDLGDHKIVARHVRHMGDTYQAARDADAEASGMALVNRMKQLDEQVDAVLTRVAQGEVVYDNEGLPVLDPSGDGTQFLRRHREATILAAVREARRNVEMRAKLAGAIPEGDDEALNKARAALASPEARRLLAELDRTLAQADGA